MAQVPPISGAIVEEHVDLVVSTHGYPINGDEIMAANGATITQRQWTICNSCLIRTPYAVALWSV